MDFNTTSPLKALVARLPLQSKSQTLDESLVLFGASTTSTLKALETSLAKSSSRPVLIPSACFCLYYIHLELALPNLPDNTGNFLSTCFLRMSSLLNLITLYLFLIVLKTSFQKLCYGYLPETPGANTTLSIEEESSIADDEIYEYITQDAQVITSQDCHPGTMDETSLL